MFSKEYRVLIEPYFGEANGDTIKSGKKLYLCILEDTINGTDPETFSVVKDLAKTMLDQGQIPKGKIEVIVREKKKF